MPIDDLKFYYPQKTLVGDGGALTEYLADSGTVTTLVDAALTQADDFWNGGIIIFLGDTPTVALRGITAHISDFDSATDTLTFAKQIPAVPAAGEKYKLILGGGFRSDTQVLSQKGAGVFPELQPIALTTITGVTVTYISGNFNTLSDSLNPDVNLDWDGVDELVLESGSGTPYTVTGDASDVVLYDGPNLRFIIVNIVQASLPGGSEFETVLTSRQQQTFTPDIEGYESSNILKGKTRYRLLVLKNEGIAVLNNLWVAMAISNVTDSFLQAGESIDENAGSFDIDAAPLNWPTGPHWVENTTNNDCRYATSRSGNTITVAAANTWTKILVDANNTVEPLPGDTVTTGSGSGIIDAIRLLSGTWAGGDANATMYIKDLTGSFIDLEQLQISAVNIAIVDGNDIKGLRDKAASTWSQFSVVRVMSTVDYAIEAPSANEFSSPASETLYPNPTLDFVAKQNVQAEQEIIGALAVNAIYGVWFREWIIDGTLEAPELIADTEYSWF